MMKICPECLERVEDDHEYCPEDGTELREIHARREDPLVGRVLDEKWVIESKIGGGGMGTVYRAHQLSVDRTVAIKILRSDLCEDDEHVQRFFREANVASKVADPRCVTIYDFGQTADDHILYLAMEFLEGEPLKDRLHDSAFSVLETLQIGIQIAAALESLHGQGVVHRDLKPENVFLVDEVGRDVFLKLLDFGLAKLAHSDATPVTASGQVFGTPEFMSPEQCMGSEVGPSSDLYSLGCLLYELVSGRTPFQSNASVEVLLAHVNRRPPEVDADGVLPESYSRLIMELLEKDPADRPGASVDVRERLEAIRGELESTSLASVVGPDRIEVGGGDVQSRETIEAGPAEAPVPSDPEGEAVDEAEPDAAVEARDGDAERAPPQWKWTAIGLVLAGLGLLFGAYWSGLFERSESGAATPERAAAQAAPETVREAIGRARQLRSRATRGAVAASAATATGGEVSARAAFLAGARTIQSSSPAGRVRATSGAETGRATASAGGGDDPQRPSDESLVGTGSGEEIDGPSGAEDDGAGGQHQKKGHGDPGIVPVLTQQSAHRIFNSKDSEVLNCIARDVSGGVSSVVTLRIELIVSGTGGIQKVEIRGSDLDSGAVRGCVKRRAEKWRFPPTPEGAPVRLMHEYNFQPSRITE